MQQPVFAYFPPVKKSGLDNQSAASIRRPGVLMMEFREAVEEATSPQALKEIEYQVQEKMKTWSKLFDNAFKDRKYEDAISSIQRMTYYHRINEEITKKL
ncbi:hypothetical protein IFM89_023743 [Coptis chinensis]|uniref:Co-chaperone HscB C-terminal oligomerisation domain-containing protein n=1 Tax=Coptis chinensis TaxID=261450 RepID=A0A835GZI5_9MAGN|nr:hypothetical protein IFM89_023743 [Coptis chinensis]